jgi:phytol kinase
VHLSAGAINIAAPLFVTAQAIIIVNLLFAGLLLLSKKTTYFSAIQSVKRQSHGDIYLPLGIALAAAILLPKNIAAFQFGVAIMGFSDALAGLVGEQYGKHPINILRTTKSLEGSATFFVSSLVITFFFMPHLNVGIILIPAILMIVELAFKYGLDNLVLPVTAALLLQLSHFL